MRFYTLIRCANSGAKLPKKNLCLRMCIFFYTFAGEIMI